MKPTRFPLSHLSVGALSTQPRPTPALPARHFRAQRLSLQVAASLGAMSMLCAPALAQTLTAPLRNAPAAAQAASSPSLTVAPKTQAKFMLREVRFTPTKAVSQAELQEAAKPFLNREIDALDLTVLSSTLRRLYEARGYGLAGVGFPSQDLSQGVLQVAIVEPRLSRISIENPPQPPVATERTQAVLEFAGVRTDTPLDLQGLDRAMYTLNDWPGVAAKATLVPTGDEGLYQVTVQTERRRAWDASIDADNYGSKASGRNRVGALLRWNNPSGRGDNLDLRALASNGQGTTVGRLGYETPLGASPWRLGVGLSRVGYELGDAFEGAGAVGSANVLDGSVSYPLVRSRDRNIVARASVSAKKLVDEFGGTTEKHIRGGELGMSFESRSTWGGGGFNGGSVGLQFGRLSIDTESYRQADAGLGDMATQGNFTKLSVQATRLQALTRTLSVFVGGAGQWASKNLDNAEKFTLGGDKGVRAYPAAEAASDQGVLLNAELRYWIAPQWSSFLFYDVGHGQIKKRPADGDDNTRTLRGAGLGLQYTNPDLFILKASLGVRGKEEPVSETSNSRTRLLVQVQHSF